MQTSAETREAPPWLEQVRQEQVAGLYRNLLIGMTPTWVAAGVLCWLLVQQGVASAPLIIGWFALISILTLARMALAFFYKRAPDARSAWRKWAWWFTAGCVASGVAWGVGTLFMMTADRVDLQLLIVVLLTALVYGALASFGRWIPAFYGFFLPAMIPSALWSLAQGDIMHIAYGVLAAIWIPFVALLALRFNAGVVQALTLGFENAALAEDLRRQKHVAEDANLAKSRFLAAASHDLRQPVHALGLLVGALKHETVSPQTARLVDQIDRATESLDELFTALLDVSRLDAGVLQPHPRPLDAQALLERIAAEMRPLAEAKGLGLRIRAQELWVRSDPVMLERVLRNLLSNAIRYTERGGVLAVVRARAGGVSFEIWDTGIGISADQRDLVFREFFQANAASGEGGLGLGLAIVQRLCALLGHDLMLHSRKGRGSVFRVVVERAPAQNVAPSPADQLARGAARLWVIDDDEGARAGMRALLSAWGYDVAVAASAAEMLRAGAARPDAILCDYRLTDEDGLTAIARLRAQLGEAIPAALITGDTAPDQLREALASGLPILHKPVARARLRALIGNLVRASAAAP